MNKKGFTLVELLAVVVIMGVLALIAIPNVTRILERGKKEQYISDAKEMISKAKYQFKINDTELSSGACNKYSLEVIDITNDYDPYWNKEETEADNHKYDLASYVNVCNSNGTYKYSVKLFSNYSGLYYSNNNLISEENIDNAYINKVE